MMLVVVEEARGSMRVMCLAEVPAARMCDDETEGKEVIERRGWEVVRVSTTVDVSRSSVLTVWSREVEYATVGSSGWKITDVVGPLWPCMRDRGPRCGVEVDVVSLRRLAVGPDEINDVGAAGASDLRVLQRPIDPSMEAESIREEGA
jgi:hypothetical protein